MKEGWLCPKCGRVNAPRLEHCDCRHGKQEFDIDKILETARIMVKPILKKLVEKI